MARSSFDEMPEEVAESAEIAYGRAGLALETPPEAADDAVLDPLPVTQNFANMNQKDLRKAQQARLCLQGN